MPVAATISRGGYPPDENPGTARERRSSEEPLETLLQGFRRLLWPQNQDYSRLQREFDSFSVELPFWKPEPARIG